MIYGSGHSTIRNVSRLSKTIGVQVSTSEDKVLTREEGIASNTVPTGRVLAVNLRSPFYMIQFADGKGGTLPDELQGLFTNEVRASEVLTGYVTRFWDISDGAKRTKLKLPVPTTNAVSG